MFCAMEEQKLGKKSGREGKKGGGEIPEKEGESKCVAGFVRWC